MSDPVEHLAAELLAVVEAGRGMADVVTDDPRLDDEFRREMRRAEVIARGLLGLGPSGVRQGQAP